MGITIRTMTTVMGRSGKPERPSFFPIRAHLLTTCEAGGGIPPSGRAVRSARLIALSAESTRQCRCVPLPPLSVRLVEGLCLVCLFAANRCPLTGQPATRLRKPANGSFIAAMDGCFPAPSIFFCRAKRNKTAPCRGRKDVIDHGDLSSGSKGRESWRRSLRLRGVGLSELQRHLQ